MRGLISLSLLPLLASSAPTFSTETIHEGVAPLLSSANSVAVPDSYIVVFKKHVTEASASEHHSWVQDIHSAGETQRTELRKRGQFPITTDIFEGLKHTYNIAGDFLGYSGHFDDSVIEEVRRHPDVSTTPLINLASIACFLPSIPLLIWWKLPLSWWFLFVSMPSTKASIYIVGSLDGSCTWELQPCLPYFNYSWLLSIRLVSEFY